MNRWAALVAAITLSACGSDKLPGGSGSGGTAGGGAGSTAGGGGAGNTGGGGAGNTGGGGAGNTGGGGAGNTGGGGAGGTGTFGKLDLLFVVDNSSSTRDKQNNFNCNVPRFLDVLRSLPGGMPDLRMAVVSTDMGSGAIAIPSCSRPGGDDGVMQSSPHPQVVDCSPHGGATLDTTGCTGPTDGKGWIRYKSATDNNIAGQDLGKALACYAALGDNGCGLESPLHAARRALERAVDPNDPINGGFLRRDALLAVVLLTDEDDCSMPADSLIGDTAGGTDLMSELGPLTSFRCAELGVVCDGFQRDPAQPTRIRAAGPAGASGYQNCRPNDQGLGIPNPRHRLLSVAALAQAIQAIKPAGQTIIEAIAAPPPPDGIFHVEIGTSAGNPVAQLGASCQGGPGVGKGDPAVRVQAFLRQWDPGKKVIPVCQQSYASALATIAQRLAGM